MPPTESCSITVLGPDKKQAHGLRSADVTCTLGPERLRFSARTASWVCGGEAKDNQKTGQILEVIWMFHGKLLFSLPTKLVDKYRPATKIRDPPIHVGPEETTQSMSAGQQRVVNAPMLLQEIDILTFPNPAPAPGSVPVPTGKGCLDGTTRGGPVFPPFVLTDLKLAPNKQN